MGRRFFLVLGWLWPFVVAALGVAGTAAGLLRPSDPGWLLLFVVALLGSPAVIATIEGGLPAAWSAESRAGLAILLAVPVVVAELVVALWLFIAGTNLTLSPWIE